jgi:hypothetical protein
VTHSLNNPDYPSILRQASGGKAGLKTIFGDSLASLVAEIGVRSRRFFRNRHLDLLIPVSILVLSASSVALIMTQQHYRNSQETTAAGSNKEGFSSEEYKFINDLALLVGATITILFTMMSMHREYHYKKREKASEYIRAWNSTDFADTLVRVGDLRSELFWDKHPTEFDPNLFDICHSAVGEFKRNANGVETLQKVQSDILRKLYDGGSGSKDLKNAVDQLLDFFEHMGLDVKNHVADSEYLKDFFFATVIDNYELFRKYIEQIQISRSGRSYYCNFVYLAQTWEKEGTMPKLPRICLRPPIVTEEDMEYVYEKRHHSKHATKTDSLVDSLHGTDAESRQHKFASVLTSLRGISADSGLDAEPLILYSYLVSLKNLGSDHPTTLAVKHEYILILQGAGLSDPEIQARLDAYNPPFNKSFL